MSISPIKELLADLIVLDMYEFNVILGMDWLSIYHSSIDCHKMKVHFQINGQLEFSFVGNNMKQTPHILISTLQAK